MTGARLLRQRLVEKPWGCTALPAPFCNMAGEPVGEIWLEDRPDDPLPLLAKYLFTSEKLSVQVHPDDAQAHMRGLPGGKDECWLVLDAEPEAALGIGTVRPLDAAELAAAAQDGSIEALIDWKPARRGDFYYIPAGTVHAIGAGLTLIEVQQTADFTYRLYDYGRPRALHVADGSAVAVAQPYADPRACSVDFAAERLLVDGPIFRVAIGGAGAALAGSGPTLILPLAGTVTANGAAATAGEGLVIDDGTGWTASVDARLLLARMVQPS